METPSNPKTEDYTYKQGQYSPRKRKDTTPKVNPQLAVELVFQELKRVEAYTKRIEDATTKKVEIDRGSLESAENRLKNVLADFERQGNRMKNVLASSEVIKELEALTASTSFEVVVLTLSTSSLLQA